MISTPADGVDRAHGASQRPTLALGAIPALAILLLSGLALRLTIAYIVLPGSGFETDVSSYISWALTLAEVGPGRFYEVVSFADYPPAYLYILWPVGIIAQVLAPYAGGDAAAAAGVLIKLPAILADLGIALLLYRMVATWSKSSGRDAARLGLVAAAFYLFNPLTWYDSAIWGQTDAVGALVMLAGLYLLLRGHPEGATVAAVVAGLIKPQFGVVLAPIVAVVLLRRHLLAMGSGPKARSWLPAAVGGWLEREQGPIRLVTSALAGLAAMLLIITPFNLDIPGLIELISSTAGGYPYLTVNAFNPWAFIGSDGRAPLVEVFGWSSDTVPLLGPLPGVVIGSVLLAGAFLVGLARLAWRADPWSIVLVTVFLSLCFFMLPTRVHERYLFPAFAFLPLLAAAQGRWRWATVILAVGSFMNLHGILTYPSYGTQNVIDLPLGELFRSSFGVFVSVALHVAVFAFVAWGLRRAALRRPDALTMATAARGGAVRDAATPLGPVAMGAPGSGAIAWLAQSLHVTPLRRDRTGELAAEPPGRLGRMDLFLVVLIVFGALTLRTYRLDQPYDMHFDEVYHARTATEFLQDWRYGIDHSVYEFTHPHLAKYGIALGLMAFGNDRVTATSDLEVPVRDAAIETRWSPTDVPGERDGDRLLVATGTELRSFDLDDRALEATLPVPALVVALDADQHVAYLGTDDATVWTVSTRQLDAHRRDPAQPLPTAEPFVTLEASGAHVADLVVVDGSVIARLADGTLQAFDRTTGEQTGEGMVAGASAAVRVPLEDRIVVDPSEVDDEAGVASQLAELLTDDEESLATAIADASAPIAVAGWLDEDTTEAVQGAIDDGSLTGVSIGSGSALAVIGGRTVTFLDATTLDELDSVVVPTTATGLALVEKLGHPMLYLAAGDELRVVTVDDSGPTLSTTVAMPGSVRDVAWDEASNLVHAVGDVPDGSGMTVYVIEPHGNAVFADARLPFDPLVALMDVQPERPADDRQDLLALSADGQTASIDVGSHAFAWRMPGVIMGAVMAIALYILARMLFQRRTVAVVAAVLVLLEGMAFANARIAMNDTYVVTFIVAAVALFAPLYMGVWRRGLAVALVLPAVGLLLGLALASKWVGAYAIGFLLLLVLLRSALGRVIALAGMIGSTGLLGALAIRAAPDVTDPRLNFTFLIIMLVLTVLLAVAMVRRPVRFTLEELRFSVLAPAVVGALLVGAGLIRGAGSTAATPDQSFLTPDRLLTGGAGMLILGALAYGGSWLAARVGVGPLAPPRPVELGEPVPSTAPTGWLRPGWRAGIPWLFGLMCLTAIPLVIYVVSYLPWVAMGNRLTEDWPPGNGGQTLFALSQSMYDYHDDLRAAHAASSPWWAWPLDLKPVWFYQDGFANSTTGVIYDSGNLVIFWMAIPAVAFAAWQAWRRRSLALTLIVLGVLCLWLPWARIDRAPFQYHVFASLPFAILALAYLVAELWHGPSSRTFLLARVAGALAILGPPLLWLFRAPLCGLAGVGEVHPDGVACGPLSRTVTVAESSLAAICIIVAGAVALAWLVRSGFARRWSASGSESGPLARLSVLPQRGLRLPLAVIGVLVVTAIAAAGSQVLVSPRPAFTLQVVAEILAAAALLLLAWPAYLAVRSRDSRRWAVAFLVVVALVFLVWYPNLTGLPLPNALASVYQGLLPTYNYDFQFAVNQDPAGNGSLVDGGTLLIGVAAAVLSLVAMIAARMWRGRAARVPAVPALGEPG